MKLKKLLITILLITTSLSVSAGWFFSDDKWEGFVYPNGNDLTIHRNIGVYDSLELCRTAALNLLEDISSIRAGDYECGLNCKVNTEYDLKVCEKTLR